MLQAWGSACACTERVLRVWGSAGAGAAVYMEQCELHCMRGAVHMCVLLLCACTLRPWGSARGGPGACTDLGWSSRTMECMIA